MQTLRNARWITRLVLVWFAMFIGAAVASPLVKPEPTGMVCSAMGGMKLVNLDSDNDGGGDSSPTSAHSLDCPLCMPVAVPAPMAMSLPVQSGLMHALHPLESARLASLIGAPWQARAPPSPSV